MSGRLLVLPSRSSILCRSFGYGAASGAAIGAIIVIMLVAVGTLTALNAGVMLPGILIIAPIAAWIGAIVGAACGLTAGLGLVIFRRQAGSSRCAVRLVAGAGAGMLPAIWAVAVMASSGHHWGLPVLYALTCVVVALAAALGPYAFFGSPRRRRRRAHHPGSVQGSREIVG